jgi:hypothetical protein
MKSTNVNYGRYKPKATQRTPKGNNKIKKVMHQFKEGELHSGKDGIVTEKKQAVAIALSEQRQYDKEHKDPPKDPNPKKNYENPNVHYTIEGRRWFDRINGNTYHSTRVYKNNELIGHVPFEYGYGDQYQQTGIQLLQEAGEIPKSGRRLSSGAGDTDQYEFRMYGREHRDKVRYSVSDVQRKKDL